MQLRILLAGLLVLLTGALGGVLLWRLATPPPSHSSSPLASLENSQPDQAASARADTLYQLSLPQGSNSFHWSQLESKDFKVYIANLRAIGCPERTIHDIIRAEVDQLYEARHHELETLNEEQSWNYWEPNRVHSPWAEYERRIKHRDLERDRETMIADLLGESPGEIQDSSGNGLAAVDTDPAKWTPELEERVHEIQEKYHHLQDEIFENSHGRIYPEDATALEEIHGQRLAELEGVLTPEQLRQFELRESPTAERMRHELVAFKPNEEEFQAIFDARKDFENQVGHHEFDFQDSAYRESRELAEEQMHESIREVLGEERFQDYELANDHRYRDLYNLGERFDVPEENVNYIFDLWQTSEQQVDQIRSNPDMDEAQRRQILESMRIELEKEAQNVLGGPVFYNYQNTGGEWIQHLFEE